MGLMVLGVLLVLVILILAANIRIVPQAHAYILERLGGYSGSCGKESITQRAGCRF